MQQGAAGRHSSRLPLAAPRSYSLTNKVSALACCVRVSFCFNVPGRRPPWLGGGKTRLTRTANGARGMIRKFPLRIQGRKQPGAAKASGLGTRYSQPLTHAGTNGARRCLTSQIGRDGVRSACCGPSRQRRQAGRRTWLRARPSSAGQSAKKKGSTLRRDGCAGCCPSAVARREGGLRSPAEQRAREGPRRSGCWDEPTPCSPCFCSCSAARPRYDPRPPSCRQDERDERPSQDERTQRPAMAVLTAADGRAADRQASGRSGSLLPATASSTLDAVDAGQNSVVCCSAQLARRSAAQPGRRPPVSLGSQRSCRVSKGLQEGWLAVSGCRAEQRSTDQLMLSPPAHAEAAAARQPAGGPPPPAHAEAAAARPPPTDRWMEDGPRGGRRQRPSSAQRQRQAGSSSSSPGRKTGITAGQLDGSGDNWPTINQRQPSRAPRLSSSAHQPCAGSVDAPQPVALRRCCVKEADRPPRPWTSKTGRHHH